MTQLHPQLVPALDLASATPPLAARKPHVEHVHGDERSDDYFWLRDETDAEVVRHLEAENAYAAAVMRPTQALQRQLNEEILSHIKQTDLSVGYELGGYHYFAAMEEGKQYPRYVRRRIGSAADAETVLDLNALAPDGGFVELAAFEVSDDGNHLAYAVDTTGSLEYALHVKDLRSGAALGEPIPCGGEIAWADDDTTIFYTTEDEVTKRRDACMRRAAAGGEPVLVYAEPDERYDVALKRSADRSCIFVGSASKSTTEWRWLPASRPRSEPRLVLARREGMRYEVEHHGRDFLLLTNDEADDFRVVRTRADAPGAAFEEVVPQRPGVHLNSLEVFEHFAVLHVRSGGFTNLEIVDLATNELRAVALPDAIHTVFLQTNPEFRAQAYRFEYTSLLTPRAIYELDLRSGASTVLKATEVLNFDPADYAMELRHATAPDGVRIPISLVYRKRAQPGPAPLLLLGYGSYGISADPVFSAPRLVLLDRGVVYAIAHVRGGGELGEHWRTAAYLQRKRTTFTDFIACAEHLVAEQVTAPDRLAIEGSSAGGMLAGAVCNERPELFRAVLTRSPFVDVVNTMLDTSLPLTTSEYLEWGNPTDASDYAYMASYSPYDNVGAHEYPAMLVRVSVNDPRVPYWEGVKLVAKLRRLKTDARPLLLTVDFGAGHAGASGRYDKFRDLAFDQAFVLSQIAPVQR